MLEEEIGVSKTKNWKGTFLNVNLCFLFDGCWFHLISDSAQPILPPGHGAQREQLQTGLPSDLIHVPTAPDHAFTTSLKPQISILVYADCRSRTSLVSRAATGLASITTKHTTIIKSIFQVIDSEVTKSSGHFNISSFKKILLIFRLTCWIDLPY